MMRHFRGGNGEIRDMLLEYWEQYHAAHKALLEFGIRHGGPKTSIVIFANSCCFRPVLCFEEPPDQRLWKPETKGQPDNYWVPRATKANEALRTEYWELVHAMPGYRPEYHDESGFHVSDYRMWCRRGRSLGFRSFNAGKVWVVRKKQLVEITEEEFEALHETGAGLNEQEPPQAAPEEGACGREQFQEKILELAKEAKKYHTCMSLCVSDAGNSVELCLDTSREYHVEWIPGEGADIGLFRDCETKKVVGCCLPLLNRKLVVNTQGPIKINDGFLRTKYDEEGRLLPEEQEQAEESLATILQRVPEEYRTEFKNMLTGVPTSSEFDATVLRSLKLSKLVEEAAHLIAAMIAEGSD